MLQLARTMQGQIGMIDTHSIEEAPDNAIKIQETNCNKDTGDTQKVLRKWSRGLLHFVRAGGHIEKWCPLYKYGQFNTIPIPLP